MNVLWYICLRFCVFTSSPIGIFVLFLGLPEGNLERNWYSECKRDPQEHVGAEAGIQTLPRRREERVDLRGADLLVEPLRAEPRPQCCFPTPSTRLAASLFLGQFFKPGILIKFHKFFFLEDNLFIDLYQTRLSKKMICLGGLKNVFFFKYLLLKLK